jgi:hypothetical protein
MYSIEEVASTQSLLMAHAMRVIPWLGRTWMDGVNESAGDGRGGSRRARADAELGEDSGDVVLNRAHANEERLSDGRIGQPGGE